MITPPITVTAEQLDTFVKAVQEMIDAYMTKNFPNNPKRILSIEPGRKYARIVETSSQRSVYCFVDMTNGDILKAETWKKPAKHARGSIHKDPLSGLTEFGAKYR